MHTQHSRLLTPCLFQKSVFSCEELLSTLNVSLWIIIISSFHLNWHSSHNNSFLQTFLKGGHIFFYFLTLYPGSSLAGHSFTIPLNSLSTSRVPSLPKEPSSQLSIRSDYPFHHSSVNILSDPKTHSGLSDAQQPSLLPCPYAKIVFLSLNHNCPGHCLLFFQSSALSVRPYFLTLYFYKQPLQRFSLAWKNSGFLKTFHCYTLPIQDIHYFYATITRTLLTFAAISHLLSWKIWITQQGRPKALRYS